MTVPTTTSSASAARSSILASRERVADVLLHSSARHGGRGGRRLSQVDCAHRNPLTEADRLGVEHIPRLLLQFRGRTQDLNLAARLILEFALLKIDLIDRYQHASVGASLAGEGRNGTEEDVGGGLAPLLKLLAQDRHREEDGENSENEMPCTHRGSSCLRPKGMRAWRG